MICSYVIDIFNRNVNMLYAIILYNEKGSRKFEIKIDQDVNNLFYFCNFFRYVFHFNIFLIAAKSMQGSTATTRHGVTKKRSSRRLKHTGNMLRKDLQLKCVC